MKPRVPRPAAGHWKHFPGRAQSISRGSPACAGLCPTFPGEEGKGERGTLSPLSATSVPKGC